MTPLGKKSVHEIYSLAKEEHKQIESRLDHVGDKPTYQWAFVAIVLGFTGVEFPRFAEKMLNPTYSISEFCFLTAYLYLISLTFFVLFSLIRVERFQDFKTIDVNEDLESFFEEAGYENAITKMTNSYLHCIRENEQILEGKIEENEEIRSYIVAILILVPLTMVFYLADRIY